MTCSRSSSLRHESLWVAEQRRSAQFDTEQIDQINATAMSLYYKTYATIATNPSILFINISRHPMSTDLQTDKPYLNDSYTHSFVQPGRKTQLSY